MEYTGTVISLEKEQQISEKFRKREFVLSDKSSQYPQTILFECQQDRCNLLEAGIAKGSVIKVHFNLNGRQWTNPKGEVKTFNTLSVWKIEKVGWDEDVSPPPAVEKKPTKQDADDDLPF